MSRPRTSGPWTLYCTPLDKRKSVPRCYVRTRTRQGIIDAVAGYLDLHPSHLRVKLAGNNHDTPCGYIYEGDDPVAIFVTE